MHHAGYTHEVDHLGYSPSKRVGLAHRPQGISTYDYWESHHVLGIRLTLPTNLAVPLALHTF